MAFTPILPKDRAVMYTHHAGLYQVEWERHGEWRTLFIEHVERNYWRACFEDGTEIASAWMKRDLMDKLSYASLDGEEWPK
jgi:hypothetical protein